SRREPADRPDGDGRAGHRGQGALRHDDGRDLQGPAVPPGGQARVPQARLPELGLRPRAGRRLGVDGAREPRHRLSRQGRRRPDGQGGDAQGGRGRVDRRRADGQGLIAQGPLHPVPQRDGAGQLGGPELPGQRAAPVQREGLQDPGQPGVQGAGRPALVQPARQGPADDAQGSVGERAGLHRRLQLGVRGLGHASDVGPGEPLVALTPEATVGHAPAVRPRRAPLSRRLAPYAGFSPAVVLFGGFFLAALALIVLYSFWEVINYNVVHNWTLDNYHYFFSTPTYVKTLWDTIWVAAVTTALTLLAAFPLAYWLARYVR